MRYTYDNSDCTSNVWQLFSTLSKKELEFFFDFLLGTTEMLEIDIKETNYQKYLTKISHFFMLLPMDTTIDAGAKQLLINKKRIVVYFPIPSMADWKGFYLKKL